MLNIINNSSFSGAPKMRLHKGDKKRPVIVIRPSLKKLQSRLDALRHTSCRLRGQLRRTTVGDVESQQGLNSALARVKQAKEVILRYVENMCSARG